MRLQVLYDAKGTILAAVDLDSQHDGPMPRLLLARRGQKTLEVEVPAEYGESDLATACGALRVDVKRRTLVAVPWRAPRASAKHR
jgi:hypothetical protein